MQYAWLTIGKGCHVMERESFESLEIADILNSHFVPVKVDREERPDIDGIYMNYVQATTGSGGWPLNVFMTPDLEPVFGGTYFPGPGHARAAIGNVAEDQVGFLDILKKMRTVWEEQEARCRESAKEITRQLREFAEEGVLGQKSGAKASESLEIELMEEAYTHFQGRYDRANGGFSSAPKFPTPANLSFMLRLGQWSENVRHIVGEDDCNKARDMALHTLRSMARGGIRDQIGYGFARYSVTKDWSLPHFEKMLYDQAQLLDVYLDAFLISRDPEMLGAAYDISTYLTTPPVAAPTAGFFSAEDADSHPAKNDTEKREGAYYVWTLKELQSVLGPNDAKVVANFYGVKLDGNVARQHDPHNELLNQNVLKVTTTPSALAKELRIPEFTVTSILKSSRQRLRSYREAHRPRPSLDDKVVVSWNGLAISALARTVSALQEIDPVKSSTCLKVAQSAANFIRKELFDESSQILYRIYRSGRGSAPGLCDDYAFLIYGLIDLYEATFDDAHLQFADTLQRIQNERFRDSEGGGGFFTTPSPHPPDLLLRLKVGMDSAEPSSNNISARNLYRLSSMLNDDSYATLAAETVMAFEAEIEQFPHCFAGMLGSVAIGRLGMKGVVLIGDPETQGGALRKFRDNVRPDATIVMIGKGRGDWLRERNELLKSMDIGKATVMVCEAGACREGVEFL